MLQTLQASLLASMATVQGGMVAEDPPSHHPVPILPTVRVPAVLWCCVLSDFFMAHGCG